MQQFLCDFVNTIILSLIELYRKEVTISTLIVFQYYFLCCVISYLAHILFVSFFIVLDFKAVLISSVAVLVLAVILSLGIPIFVTHLMLLLHLSATQTSLATPLSITSATPLSTSAPTRQPANFLLTSKPKIIELLLLECGEEALDVIARVASECNTFGIHLGLESHIVNIEWDVPGRSAEFRCQKIVEQWLKGRGKKGSKGKPVTWRTVVEALRSVGHNVLADSLSKC